MTSWAGHRPTEFGIYPVELHFSLDSHSGPTWVVPSLFNRSGWLAVAEVEMETEFDCTRAVIAACVNDQGEVLGQWVVDALFSMQCSLPNEVVTEPPDDLADALDALYWDFLGRCDLAHLRALEEKEQQIASAIARQELRRKGIYEKVETFLSGLHARRRRERSRADQCARIDAKIEEIEIKQSDAETWHRNQLKALHSELEAFEAQVLSALRNHGRFQQLYTVHWRTRHSRDRTIDNTSFQMLFGLPRPATIDIDLGSMELEARLHGMESRERKRQEFDDYYHALEDAVEKSRTHSQSLRQISEALAQDKSAQDKLVQNNKKKRREKQDDNRSAGGGFQALAAQSRAWEARRNGTEAEGPVPVRVVRPKLKNKPVPAGVGAPLPARSKAISRTRPDTAPVVAFIPSECVCPGDRVLLRYVDPPGARSWFTLTGDENIPAQGIVALHDERAIALLGKRVGDRVGLLINQTHRFAEIESITRPAEPAR